MMPKIYASIEQAVANGVQPQYLASALIAQGWPRPVVNEAVNAWLAAHGRLHQKTGFKDWVKKYKRKALPATLTIIFISVISSAILLLRPWPTKIMVDSAFGNIPAPGPLEPYTHQPVLILITSIMTIAIFLVGFLFGTVRDYLVLRLGFWLNRGIKEESFRHILHLPLYHQERLAKGDYIYRQNVLTSSLSDLVLDTTSSIAQSVIMIIGVLIIMFFFNVKLTLISVVMIPFLFVLVRLFGPVLSKISMALTQTASDTSSTITESIDNAETVQSFTLEEKQIAKADNLWRRTFQLSRRGMLWSRGYRFSNSLLIIIGTSAVMYFGGKDALYGFNHPGSHAMTLGQLLIFMTYMGYLLGPVEELAAQIAARNQKLIDVSRIYEVLTDHEGIENLRRQNHFPMTHGRIDFQNVSYAYGDTWVIKNLNLTIDPGQKIGIIGPSGGGKSTLLKMIPLFIEPGQGRIMIDNVDIQTVSLKELRQRIAWISQSPQLFNEPIVENLTDGDINRQITEPEILQAAEVAYVNEFTKRLPMGLNSTAGEGGSSLSGGQKQRIAIARGLVKKSPIVCMDEPTAALDAKSENFIRDSIAKLISGKTVLMVTHRKALLSLMDKIYVMDNSELKDVKEYGGLDAYLQKITDTENSAQAAKELRSEETKAAEADERRQLQQRLAQLENENAKLSQKVELVSQQKLEDSQTLHISHGGSDL
jgi:ABC-type bacteriocin/lantibiotic exporter with double-glycine peptidase domain